jgi:glutathione S-transferase
MALTLHHLEKSRSHRILWLLEELELDYSMVEYKRDPATFRADPALRAIHPLGKAPIVTDGDAVLAETGAIIEHLLEHHGAGRLQPSAAAELRDYRYFMHYAEGSLMPPLLVRLIFAKLSAAKVPFFIKPIVKGIVDKVEANYTRGELLLHAGFLDAHLAKQPYFAGEDLTAADIQMSYPVLALVDRGEQDPATITHLRDWATRIRARPAFARALAKGGELF